VFALWTKYLGDQWSIGDWDGLIAAAPHALPAWLAGLAATLPIDEPPQNLKEYDPEWARAFHTGTVAASCDHETMLAAVKVPILFTHHFHAVDETSGALLGAISDLQTARVAQLVAGAGQPFDYRSFPEMGHSMHGQDPQLFTNTLVDWVESISAPPRLP
jgi:pimeloyl-ACP methyl ester carboxylesterase